MDEHTHLEAQFLIVRPDDLIVLGVRWSGFEPAHDARVLEAQSNDARVVLTFPPQAITEEKTPSWDSTGGTSFRPTLARLSGPSQIEFAVPAGTRMPLNTEGILTALLGSAHLVLGAPSDEHTAIEMPWHLIVSTQAPSPADTVVSEHPASSIVSAAGTVGLWRTRLRASSTLPGTPDAGLMLLPLRSESDVSSLETFPLTAEQRQQIVSESASALPLLRRMELSALGSSLSTRLIRPNFEWEHDASLGRDQRVRVLNKGMLYPTGHRATYLEMTERIFDPQAAQSIAGLHKKSILIITEPVRSATNDAGLARQFPFSEVEILARSFTDLADHAWVTHKQESFALVALEDELHTWERKEQALIADLNNYLASLPQNVQGMIDQGFGSGQQLAEAQQNARDLCAKLNDLLQQRSEDDAKINALESQLSQGSDPDEQAKAEIQQQIQGIIATEPTNGQIQAAQAAYNKANAALEECFAKVQSELNNIPRTIEQLILSGDEQAGPLVELRGQIAQRQSVLDQIKEVQDNPLPLYVTPWTGDGQKLLFPLRCAGANGDICFSVPLVFVNDLVIDATEYFPAFVSLTDADVADLLSKEWTNDSGKETLSSSKRTGQEDVAKPPVLPLLASAEAVNGRQALNVPLPGVPIDLVRAVTPQPGDIHEVHQLSIAGIAHDGAFRPILTQIEAKLPTLRALLPAYDKRVTLEFTPAFLQAGEQVDVPLKMVPDLTVDFTGQANRSGGLVAPKFAADVISRTLGPTPANALPGQAVPDLSSIYADATLLGLPLGSVINIEGPEGLPSPPKIVPVLVPGQPPGVKMQWMGVPLKNHGPLQIIDTNSTKLDLSVEHSPLKNETSCAVKNFKLVLPPGGEELLTLQFGSLVFIQQAGHAPDLQINHLDVKFDGGLKLLAGLQEELMKILGQDGNKPMVHATSVGITAAYMLSLPSVSASAFLLRNIAIQIGVDVPFDRNPVTVSLSFARRDNPFNLSVLMFGGGGYIDLQIGPTGLTRLEASMDFGASVAVDFIVASGEVHALGGLRYVQVGKSIEIEGFIRIGGSVEVLGLVSVSIELLVTLTYQSTSNRMVGRATLIIEVDLTLFSHSVEIDSGEWVLIGGDSAPPTNADMFALPIRQVSADAGLQAWKTYREAFHEGDIA